MQIEIVALRHQIAVYKQTVSRPRLRTSDRSLWAWLSRLWPGWQDALEFVQPGRPVIAPEVQELIRDMGRSNPTWGAPRIVGELRTLGLHVAKSTVEK